MISVLFATLLTCGTIPTDAERPYGFRMVIFADGLPTVDTPDALRKPQPIHERDGQQLTIGTAKFFGKFGLQPEPSQSHAKIRLSFSATGWTDLTTYRGNLVVRSQYSSRVDAGSTYIVGSECVVGGPSQVDVCTRTESLDVDACRNRVFSRVTTGLVSRVLEGRKSELAKKVAEKTAAKIHRQVDKQSATLLPKINDFVTEAMRKLELGDVEPRLSSSSTRDYADIRILMSGLSGWEPRPFPKDRRGVQVVLHESALTMYSQILGGRVTQLANVEKALKSWVQNPKPVKSDDDAVDSIQLVKKKPIIVRFSGGNIHFNLRAEKVFRGKRVLDGVKIETKYRPQIEDNAVSFVRVGKVNVSLLKPPPKGKMTLQQLTRLEMMRRSFPKLIPAQLVLNLERFGAIEADTSVELDDGWLAIQISAKSK